VAISFAPSNIPRIAQTEVDLQVLVFTSAVALIAGILFGLAPALSGARGQTSHSLKEAGTRISSGSTSLIVRHVLVGGQMALAVMILISACLLLRSFLNVVRLDPGFHTAQVLSGYVNLAESRYSDPRKQAAFFEEALRRIRALPGVTSAAVSSSVPLTEINDTGSVRIEGRPDPRAGDGLPSANRPHVSSGYFETMGIPVVQGRSFDSRDRSDALPVVREEAVILTGSNSVNGIGAIGRYGCGWCHDFRASAPHGGLLARDSKGLPTNLYDPKPARLESGDKLLC
jgi:putative ABC transport system permease protein